MRLLEKSVTPFALKAADDAQRTFQGLASTWDLDLGGDVIHKGAFAKTLQDWRGNQRIIPLIDQHRYGSTFDVLGKMTAAEETDAGLMATFRVVEGDDGDRFLHRVKDGLVNGLSIGYETIGRAEITETESNGVKRAIRNLREIKLHEVSAVIWGMNPHALIDGTSVKAAVEVMSDEEKAALRALLEPPPVAVKMLDPEAQQALKQRLLALTLRRISSGSGSARA